MGILVILAEKALWVFWCPNGFRHVTLDVLVTLWGENNIFGFFGVWHANQGWTKYGINNCTKTLTSRRTTRVLELFNDIGFSLIHILSKGSHLSRQDSIDLH